MSSEYRLRDIQSHCSVTLRLLPGFILLKVTQEQELLI
jgi:hypothetical protein